MVDSLFVDLFELLGDTTHPFGVFYRTSLQSSPSDKGRRRDLLPLPLICYQSARGSWVECLINLTVIAINYLNNGSRPIEAAMPAARPGTATQQAAMQLIIICTGVTL